MTPSQFVVALICLAIFVGILVWDIVLWLLTVDATITDVMRHVDGRCPWFSWTVGAGMAFLWWHLFRQGRGE
jgi:hypothetical protein